MIKNLSLENFKGFNSTSIDFNNRLNVFIGENGSGKSSILEALYFLIFTYIHNNPRKNFYSRDDINLWINKNSEELNLKISSSYGNFAYQASKNKHKFYDDLKQADYLSENKDIPIFTYYPATRLTDIEKIDTNLTNKKISSLELTRKKSLVNFMKSSIFNDFILWIRLREDIENERIRDKKDYVDTELTTVKKAIKNFLDVEDIRVYRSPDKLCVLSNEKWYDIKQLSDGERGLLCLVGDIARRLGIANPHAKDPSQSFGTILIDEIELHLHPKWQRTIIPNLLKTFPNCQFIITTHSPQVLTEVKNPNEIWILEKNKDLYHPEQVYGLNTAEILEELMNTEIKPTEITNEIEKIGKLINNRDFTEARQKMAKLSETTHGSIPALVGLNSMLTIFGENQVDFNKRGKNVTHS